MTIYEYFDQLTSQGLGLDHSEEFEDANGNKKYDDGEQYTDSNGNGKWDREWNKEDGNGEYNLGEPFVDIEFLEAISACECSIKFSIKIEILYIDFS